MFSSKFQSSSKQKLSINSDNLSNSFINVRSRPQIENASFSSSTKLRANRNNGFQLQQFGGPLPVSVTEALRFRKNVVGGFGPTNLVYIICDRQLIIWNWIDDGYRKVPKCYSLLLPLSNGRYAPERVLLRNSENSAISCLVITKEGIVRYWNNVIHENVYSEIIIDCQKHECMSVLLFQNRNDTFCVITASGELVLINKIGSGLQWRLIKFTTGLLSGIGRRMSSLFFASSSQAALGEYRCACVGEILPDGSESVYIIAGGTLRKCIFNDIEETVAFQCPVESFFIERLADVIWKQNISQVSNIKVCLLDVKCTKSGLFVLGCGVNPEVDLTCYYAVGILHTEGKISPQSFLSFYIIPVTTLYTDTDKFGEGVFFRLLLDDKSNAFVYSKKSVVCLSLANSSDNMYSVDFSPADQMIGFGFANSHPAFFSLSHGLQRLYEASQSNNLEHSYREGSSQLRDSDSSFALTSVTQDKILELTMSEDELSQFKAAFLNYTSKNLPNAFTLLDELFPSDIRSSSETSLLDMLTLQLSKDILDDYPAKDPRWAKILPSNSTFSTASLILMHQLNDKSRVHSYFIEFLKAMNLNSKLSVVQLRGNLTPTSIFLCEQTEKIAVARILVELHAQHVKLIDTVISHIVAERNDSSLANGLTHQDIFFREVSRINDFIFGLVDVENDFLNQNLPTPERVGIVKSANSIIIGIISAVNQCRQEYETESIQAIPPSGAGIEYIPWFCPIDQQTGKFLLLKQHLLTCNSIKTEAANTVESGLLYQQLVVLTDIILDSYNTWFEWKLKQQGENETLESTSILKQEFDEQKRNLLQPFLTEKRFDQAAALAEKYCEFNTLLEICEASDNQDRLQKYMHQFQGRGFGEFVCKWYAERGLRGHLLGAKFVNQPSLKNFLRSNENRFMSWLHEIDSQDYYGAHKSLLELALKETHYLSKKKTLLALSKLSALASDKSANDLEATLNTIQREQELVLHQDKLPLTVVEALAMDAENMHVLSVMELVECYVSCDINPTANENDFKKALDLVYFVDDNKLDVDEIRLHIWSQALLRDKWESAGNLDAIAVFKNTTFYKTVLLCDDRSIVPPVEVLLLTNELTSLREKASFEYLLRAGYEQMKSLS